jgi:hypothetical protein
MIPSAAMYLIVSHSAGTTAGGTSNLTVGPMRLVYNRMLALPSL